MGKLHRRFEDEIELLYEKLLRFGSLVEQAMSRAVQALVQRDAQLAGVVIDGDAEIDAFELEIDDLCLELLALQQPLARDLRFITTTMKITPELERIADHAVNIAERTLELVREPPLQPLVDIPMMAERAQEMVRLSLDALVRKDGEAARAIIAMDAEVNRHMEKIFREALATMYSDPESIQSALRLTFIAKALERIGDQAKNICEQIVFMNEAKVIKHRADDHPGA